MVTNKTKIANGTRTQEQSTNRRKQVEIKRLELNQLRIDGDTCCRKEIEDHAFVIKEYSEAMRDREERFPPVKARFDGANYWLWDGFLRLEATRKAGYETIEVEVTRGSLRDAILDGIGANKAHGLPLLNAEKREAVSRLLNDEEWSQWSNREIAKYCNVSHGLVNKMAAEHPSGYRIQTGVKFKRNGKELLMKPARKRTKRLSQKAIELLSDTPFADDTKGVGKLARRPEAVQEVAAQLIADGRTRSAEKAILEAEKEIREGQSKHVKNVPLDPKNKGKYRTIMIDPPWDLGGGGRLSPSSHYKVMSFAEIEYLEIDDYAAKDCHLYLWVVKGVLPEAFGLVDMWGFEFQSTITWAKVDSNGKPMLGSGSYFRNCTEFILFATRGNLPALRHDLPNFFEAERHEHSEKPDAAYELAEKMSPAPRLEMYARKTRPGWTPHGDQVDLLAA